MSCCTDMRFHLGLNVVVESGHLGHAFVVLLDNTRRLAPVNHCPWCGTELRPKEGRPKGTLYKP